MSHFKLFQLILALILLNTHSAKTCANGLTFPRDLTFVDWALVGDRVVAILRSSDDSKSSLWDITNGAYKQIDSIGGDWRQITGSQKKSDFFVVYGFSQDRPVVAFERVHSQQDSSSQIDLENAVSRIYLSLDGTYLLASDSFSLTRIDIASKTVVNTIDASSVTSFSSLPASNRVLLSTVSFNEEFCSSVNAFDNKRFSLHPIRSFDGFIVTSVIAVSPENFIAAGRSDIHSPTKGFLGLYRHDGTVIWEKANIFPLAVAISGNKVIVVDGSPSAMQFKLESGERLESVTCEFPITHLQVTGLFAYFSGLQERRFTLIELER